MSNAGIELSSGGASEGVKKMTPVDVLWILKLWANDDNWLKIKKVGSFKHDKRYTYSAHKLEAAFHAQFVIKGHSKATEN